MKLIRARMAQEDAGHGLPKFADIDPCYPPGPALDLVVHMLGASGAIALAAVPQANEAHPVHSKGEGGV